MQAGGDRLEQDIYVYLLQDYTWKKELKKVICQCQ